MKQQMYSNILGATLIVLLAAHAYAQAPNRLSYQAVIRNSTNQLVINQSVTVRISILQGDINGSVVYTEIQSTTTNMNGLVTLEIGAGNFVSDGLANIDWQNGPFFIKTETDPTGGTIFSIVGTTQLLSVPYALHAKTTASVNGTIGYLPKFTGQHTLGNSILRENSEGRLGLNVAPNDNYKLFILDNQDSNSGDGKHSLYCSRSNNFMPNSGSGYGLEYTNTAISGNNFSGDIYTFGTAGFNYDIYNRSGGVLGSENWGTYWGSLGYKNSAGNTFGTYGSSAYSSGSGFLLENSYVGIGGGFYGNLIGCTSHGRVIGQLNSGSFFASYNMGNTYTYGKNIELVGAQNQTKTALYSVSSVDATIYSKGSAQLVNGQAFIEFDDTYSLLLGENPVVTVSPNGNCNGVYVAEVTKEGFTVRELNNGASNAPISWIAVGNRIDNRMDEATRIVSAPDFNRNIQQVLFDDGNTDGTAMGIWWDGQQLQFGELPEHLTKSPNNKLK
jgi:hypothetical protein